MKKRKFDYDLFGIVGRGVFDACLIYMWADKIAQGNRLMITISVLLVILYIVELLLFFQKRKK